MRAIFYYIDADKAEAQSELAVVITGTFIRITAMTKPKLDFDLEKACEILSAHPKTLQVMLGDLSPEGRGAIDRSYWSPYDVVGHLIFGEETDWIPGPRSF